MPPCARLLAALLGLQVLAQCSSDAAFECSLHARAAAFWMGTLSLHIVLGRHSGIPRHQRLCQQCTLHAVHDERHLVLESPAMQIVRDRNRALSGLAKGTMQLFMWQPDIVGVAHFLMDWFDLLGTAPDAHDNGSSDLSSTSSALAGVCHQSIIQLQDRSGRLAPWC